MVRRCYLIKFYMVLTRKKKFTLLSKMLWVLELFEICFVLGFYYVLGFAHLHNFCPKSCVTKQPKVSCLYATRRVVLGITRCLPQLLW